MKKYTDPEILILEIEAEDVVNGDGIVISFVDPRNLGGNLFEDIPEPMLDELLKQLEDGSITDIDLF